MNDKEISFLLKQLNEGRVKTIVLRDVGSITISDEGKDKGWRYRYVVAGESNMLSECWYKPPQEGKRQGEYVGKKKPYAMIFEEAVKRLNSDGMKGNIVNQKAALFDLSSCIEMNTGRLKRKRKDAKGQNNMTMAHIAKAINRSLNTTKKIIGELMTNGILEEKQGEYYVSRSIISKGEKRK
jgi:hypothetical protein